MARGGASLTGVAAMQARIRKLQTKFPDAVGAALYAESQIELTEVKRRTPVDKGNLRASEIVLGPIRQGRSIYTLIVAGGPSAPYALYVHENLEALHKVGQAKYIESVINESRNYIATRIAKRLELAALNA